MFNLQDAMADLLALLGRTLVDDAEKLDVAQKLHSNKYTVATLLWLSDSELDGLICDLFPAASPGVKMGFKAAIRSQKESVAPPNGEPISKKPKRSPAEHPPPDYEGTVNDTSTYLRDLLEPPSVLPISAAELQDFLSRNSGPLPVFPDTFMSVKDPKLVKPFSPAEVKVASLVDDLFSTDHRSANCETDSSHNLRILTGDFLKKLNNLAPSERRLLHLT